MNYCKVTCCRFPHSHVTKGHSCGKCNKYGHGIYECNKPDMKIELSKDNTLLEPKDYCTIEGCQYKKYHMTNAHQCKICLGNHSESLHNIDLTSNPNANNNNINDTEYNEVECPICRTNNKIKINQTIIKGLTEKCCVCLDKEIEIFLPDCGHTCICKSCFDTMKVKKSNNINDKISNQDQLPDTILMEAKRKFGNLLNVYCILYAGMGCQWYIRKKGNQDIEGFFMHQDSWGQYGVASDDTPYLNTFINNYQII